MRASDVIPKAPKTEEELKAEVEAKAAKAAKLKALEEADLVKSKTRAVTGANPLGFAKK